MTRGPSLTASRQSPLIRSKIDVFYYYSMKQLFIVLTAALAFAAACTEELSQEGYPADDTQYGALNRKLAGGSEQNAVQGSLLVKIDESALTKAGTMFEELGIIGMAPAISVKPKNEEVARKYGLHLWHELSLDNSADLKEAAERVAAEPYVIAVQYNSEIEHIQKEEGIPYTGSSLATRSSDLPFNDPMLADQWNLINLGEKRIAPTAVVGADIGVRNAWDLTAGDPRVVVAVLDEGVMVAHEDLKEAMWVNEKEKNGQSGVDDDGNGYVDDINGYNFIEDKGRPSATGNQYTGHGTHVAGIIAATNNNGKGVSSIAGGSGNGDGVRIMSCQIFRKGEKAADKTTANAFIYAADNGASIAQCSYGSIGGALLSDEEFINGKDGYSNPAPLEYAAIQYFMDPANSNCEAVETNIVVFAAGNNSGDAASYPGALPLCISVTAFGPDFLPGGYSNYGPGCDISAPGGDPWIAENLGTDQQTMILSTGVTGSGYSSAGYTYNSGTSMACPHVSGVVALGMSYALKLGKKFTREDFVSRLLTSVNVMDHLLGSGTKPYNYENFELSRYKGKMGTGAADAWQFLNSLEGIPSVITVPGEKLSIKVSDYIDYTYNNLSYEVTADDKSRSSLGIEGDPVIKDGYLELTCTKTGSGRIKLSSSIGKDTTREDGISGLEFSREISIVSRPFAARNGGWF